MFPVKPITTHLWFDTQAREAADFYCSLFPDSAVESIVRLRNTPSGESEMVSFELHGRPFKAISAGPTFKFNPSVSLLVNFDPSREPGAAERLERSWAALAKGGEVLMPLDAYPFSRRYGWLQDRYGLSWQLLLSDPEGEPRPPIMPALLFTGEASGKAEEAGAFYRSLFEGSAPGQLVRYPEGMEPERAGTVMYSDFLLGGSWFAAMDSARAHGFGFNEAVSFMVHCRDQDEIDRCWAQLSSVPKAEQCGWCKDRYGVSWQVTPEMLDELMSSGDQDTVDRVTRALLGMKKLDMEAIEAAAQAE